MPTPAKKTTNPNSYSLNVNKLKLSYRKQKFKEQKLNKVTKVKV